MPLPQKDKLRMVLDWLHNIGVFGLSIAWTIAMITLWDWNVQYTGTWFAVAMIALGVLVFCMKLAMELNLWDKFKAWRAKRREEKNKTDGYIR